MKYWKLGLLAPIALLCFLAGSSGHTVEPRAALRQVPITATEFILTIQGSKQGQFKGDGQSNEIRGLSYDLQVTVPIDTSSGQAAGKRQHKPFTIVKNVDVSSPQILTALATNELLPAVQLNFYTMDHRGVQVLSRVITLTDASIVNVHHHAETGLKDASSDKHELEEVSFIFRKIEFDDKVGKTTYVDDWSDRQP